MYSNLSFCLIKKIISSARGCKNDVNISDPSAYGFYYHMNAPDGDAFQYGRWEGPYAKGI